MKIAMFCMRLLWWLAAASIPLLNHRFYETYRNTIQCPAYGDCYTPGSEHLLGIEMLVAFSGVAIWPLFVWYVFVKPWRSRTPQRRIAND
jgi:hypothetical protein